MAVRFAAVPVRAAVMGVAASACESVPFVVLSRLVICVMPLFAWSSVLCARFIWSSSVLRFVTLVWNEFAMKKFVALSSAVFTLRPVARRVCVVVISSVVCWRARRFARTPVERTTSFAILCLVRRTHLDGPRFERRGKYELLTLTEG